MSDGEDGEDGLMVVKFDKKEQPSTKADRWFSQGVFDQVEESDGEDASDHSDEELVEDRVGEAEKIDGFDPNLTYKEQRQKAKNTRSRRRRLEKEEEKKKKQN